MAFRMHIGWLAALVFLLAGAAPGQVQPPAPTRPAPAAAPLDPSVEITLKTSRQQTSAEAVFEILADVKNNSSEAVWFLPRFFTMIVPPEIDSTADVHVWYAMLPGHPTLTTTQLDFLNPF